MMNKQTRKMAVKGLKQWERKWVKGLRNLYDSLEGEDTRNNLLVSVISSEHWFGDYGYVGVIKNGVFDFDDIPFEQKKMVMNILEKNNTKYFFVYDNYGDEKAYHLYVYPKECNLLIDRKQNSYLVLLENKQIFDLINSYWYSVSDSYLLRKELTRGYWYDNPQEFYYDFHYED